MTHSPIIVALDHDTDQKALALLQELDPEQCRIKIGSILFTHYGPSLLTQIQQRGFSIFLDLKFHDIPETVAGACRAAAELGTWMINVHVSGGREMMMAARKAVQEFRCEKRPLLIGVTVLTSLDDSDLITMGYREGTTERVLRLARLAYESGLDGVVCSAHEASLLREHLPPGFLLVVPGIRLTEGVNKDQKRVMTPKAAIAAGADYLVIGRAITHTPNPRETLAKVLEVL